jgi:ribosome-associated protein
MLDALPPTREDRREGLFRLNGRRTQKGTLRSYLCCPCSATGSIRLGGEPYGNHDDHERLLAVRADLPSRIATPEGGLLTIATTRTTKPQTLQSSLDRACLSARVALDNKGRDVLVLDMRGITPLYDFFVLATGASRRQIHTIAEEIDASLHERGDQRLSIAGYEASKWVVQDYGDVMVHVFDSPTREYYSLEDLWADAPRVNWERYA